MDNKALHAHTILVFTTIGNLIDEGLKDSELFHYFLQKIVRNHRVRSLPFHSSDIKKLTDVMIEYIGRELSQQKTATLDSALRTFFNTITDAFDLFDETNSNNEMSSESSESGEEERGSKLEDLESVELKNLDGKTAPEVNQNTPGQLSGS